LKGVFVDRGKNPNVVRVFARVDVQRWDKSPLDEATAFAIHGATSDFAGSHIHIELREMGLLGCRVELFYNPDDGRFCAFSHHESAAPLGDQQVELLKERTNGDWCDGVAAGFFEYLGESLGLDVQVCWRGPLVVSQFEGQKWRFNPWSNLASASCRGDVEGVRAALEAGEDVNASPEGLPILQCAIVGGHVAVAQLLIEHGADVNASDELSVGRTPLRTCVTSVRKRKEAIQIARMLLEHGADPIRPTGSVLDVARRRKWDAMVQLLEEFVKATAGPLVAPGTELRVGDRIQIGRGWLAGQVGVVEQSVSADAAHSAKFRIKIFGRDLLIDVPFNDIWSPGTSDKPGSLD
jgi:hypothetical protein